MTRELHSANTYRLQDKMIPNTKHAPHPVPDSWCAANIKCRRCIIVWPFCKTALFWLYLVRIGAASMDLRRVRLAAETIRVAAAHYIAVAKVRVAQKPCQLRPDWLKKNRQRKQQKCHNKGARSTRHMLKPLNRHRSSKGRKQ